jgi:hypothetical protein
MEDIKNNTKKKLEASLIIQTLPNKLQKTNKENIPSYSGWKNSILNLGDAQPIPSERAATPSESLESCSKREPLAAKQP